MGFTVVGLGGIGTVFGPNDLGRRFKAKGLEIQCLRVWGFQGCPEDMLPGLTYFESKNIRPIMGSFGLGI